MPLPGAADAREATGPWIVRGRAYGGVRVATAGVRAGWYADPRQPGQARYYDGTAWTQHVVPLPTTDPTTDAESATGSPSEEAGAAQQQERPEPPEAPVRPGGTISPETPVTASAGPLPPAHATWGSPVGPPHVASHAAGRGGPVAGSTVGGGTAYAAFAPVTQAMPGFGVPAGGSGMPAGGRSPYAAFDPGQHPGPAYGTPSYGTPAYGAPAYGTPAYGAPAYGYGYGVPAPAPRGRPTARRLLVVAGVTLLVLLTAGGLTSVLRASRTARTASGAPLTMVAVAPAFLVGRAQSDAVETARVRARMEPFVTSMRLLPGSGQTHVQPYGPGTLGEGAPYRGPNGEIVLLWSAFSAPVDQRTVAAGLMQGGRSYYDNPTVLQTNEADGGVLACIAETSTTRATEASLCYWVRSGTGLIVVGETGVPAATVQQDARQAVADMTHR